MRALLFGYGYWGKKIARVISQPQFNLEVSIYDPNIADLRSDYAQKIGTAEIVFIATPEDTHYDLLNTLIINSKTKAIFVEKPLTLSHLQTETILKKSLDQKKLIFLDEIFLWDNATHYIKDIIQKQKLGTLKKITSYRYSTNIQKPNISVSDDLSPHDIYLARFFMGAPITSISCNALHYHNKHYHEATILLRTSSILFETHLSWRKMRKMRKMRFDFTNGRLVWEKKKNTDTITSYIKHNDKAHKKQSIFYVENNPTPLEKVVTAFLKNSEETDWNSIKEKYNDYQTDTHLLETIRKTATC